MDKLLKFLSAAVHDTAYTPDSETDYHKLFESAAKQNVQFLIYPALPKAGEPYAPDKETTQIWSKSAALAALGISYKKTQFYDVLSAIDKAGINVVLLKGFPVSALYPKPFLRLMADVDLLVDKADEARFNVVMLNCGYKIFAGDESGVVTYKKEKCYTVELFRSINHDVVQGQLNKDVTPFESFKYVSKLENTTHIAYIVNHIRKHLYFMGAGIRNLSDLFLALTRWEFDKTKLCALIEDTGNGKLFAALVALIEKYFDYKCPFELDKIDEELPDLLLQSLLRDGIYGNKNVSNTTRAGAINKENKIKTFFKLLFPPYRVIANRYKWVNKCPILLPVGWLIRTFSAVFSKRARANFKYSMSDNAKIDYKMFQLLK